MVWILMLLSLQRLGWLVMFPTRILLVMWLQLDIHSIMQLWFSANGRAVGISLHNSLHLFDLWTLKENVLKHCFRCCCYYKSYKQAFQMNWCWFHTVKPKLVTQPAIFPLCHYQHWQSVHLMWFQYTMRLPEESRCQTTGWHSQVCQSQTACVRKNTHIWPHLRSCHFPWCW